MTNVKRAITKEVIPAYPDFTKPFDTSPPPLNSGAMITQDNMPIAYVSRKLFGAQSPTPLLKQNS